MATKYRFVWDPRKADANERKHGISFEHARRVFFDPLVKNDMEGYNHGEIRWTAIGEIDGRGVAIVIHTSREESEDGTEEIVEIIRIISARRASPRERALYSETS
ncbi:MAG TPA: BrnT family toxin [Rhizomicrobium sp.]|nr:BrnT family toxin [Rhizomicrobium sp.]